MARNETGIVKSCLLAASRFPWFRGWRNNTGTAWQGKRIALTPGQVITARPGDMLIRGASFVKYGLPGSGDIIGIRALEIKPDMVGKTIGQFVSLEVKTAKGTQREQQIKFQKMIQDRGGLCEVVRSADDTITLLKGDINEQG